MVKYKKMFPQNVNPELLIEEVRANIHFQECLLQSDGILFPNYDAIYQSELDDIFNNHNYTNLSDAEKLVQAKAISQGNIVVRIREELAKATPDWSGLYTNVRDFVLSNPSLTQAMLNRVELHENAYGITIDTNTLQGKARYLDIALTLIPLYL